MPHCEQCAASAIVLDAYTTIGNGDATEGPFQTIEWVCAHNHTRYRALRANGVIYRQLELGPEFEKEEETA